MFTEMCINMNTTKKSHDLSIENRKKLCLTGIEDMKNFDDKHIIACIDSENIIIRGEFLNIKKLDLESGELEIDGKIYSIEYKKIGAHKKIFSKIFK